MKWKRMLCNHTVFFLCVFSFLSHTQTHTHTHTHTLTAVNVQRDNTTTTNIQQQERVQHWGWSCDFNNQLSPCPRHTFTRWA